MTWSAHGTIRCGVPGHPYRQPMRRIRPAQVRHVCDGPSARECAAPWADRERVSHRSSCRIPDRSEAVAPPRIPGAALDPADVGRCGRPADRWSCCSCGTSRTGPLATRRRGVAATGRAGRRSGPSVGVGSRRRTASSVAVRRAAGRRTRSSSDRSRRAARGT